MVSFKTQRNRYNKAFPHVVEATVHRPNAIGLRISRAGDTDVGNEAPIAWCKSNCKGRFHTEKAPMFGYTGPDGRTTFIFRFADAEDAALFKLFWWEGA